MMSLDDAVIHCKARAKVDCSECAKEHQQLAEWLEELKSYKDLEEQGKLLKLPCAVGDMVYEIQELRKRVQAYTIIAVHVSNCGNLYGWELKDGKGVYSNVNGFSESAIGKTVFLTHEEAEVALKALAGQTERKTGCENSEKCVRNVYQNT